MKQVSESEIAKDLSRILDQAGDEPIVIARDGKPVGILRAWPEIDESLDLARSDEFWRMIEARRGSKAVPWETAKEDLGVE
jgi:antitoxin (DNA-binding transcriptional repressor) of toxin-antitoxin stability system